MTLVWENSSLSSPTPDVGIVCIKVQYVAINRTGQCSNNYCILWAMNTLHESSISQISD